MRNTQIWCEVVQIGPRSRELCGGTHASRSGDIGFISIQAESAVASGVRRVEAFVATAALGAFLEQRKTLKHLSESLRSSECDVALRVDKLLARNRELERQVEQAQHKLVSLQGSELSDEIVIGADGVKILASIVKDRGPRELRELADDLKNRLGSGCIALGSISEGKAILLTAITDDLLEKYHAGNLIKEMSKLIGARGGGRADLAQAGGGDPSKLESAMGLFKEVLA